MGAWIPAFAGMTWEGAGMTLEKGNDVDGCGMTLEKGDDGDGERNDRDGEWNDGGRGFPPSRE